MRLWYVLLAASMLSRPSIAESNVPPASDPRTSPPAGTGKCEQCPVPPVDAPPLDPTVSEHSHDELPRVLPRAPIAPEALYPYEGEGGQPLDPRPPHNQVQIAAPRVLTTCLADDVSPDMANCGGAGTRRECTALANERDLAGRRVNACEWFAGACRPISYGGCDRNNALHGAGDMSVQYFSSYIADAQAGRLPATYQNYEEIRVFYDGHGPHAQTLGILGANVVVTANRVSRLLVRTFACSSFANLAAAIAAVSGELDLLPQAARLAAQRRGLVTNVIGNQFTSQIYFRSLVADAKFDAMSYGTQSHANMSVTLAPAAGGLNWATSWQDFYACKWTKYRHPLVYERICSNTDQTKGQISTCKEGARQLTEKCVAASIPGYRGQATDGMIPTHTVVSNFTPASAWFHGIWLKTGVIAPFTYAEANGACTPRPRQLYNIDRLRHFIESKNYYSHFTAGPEAGKRVWSFTNHEANTREAYDINALVIGNSPLGRFYEASSGYLMCLTP